MLWNQYELSQKGGGGYPITSRFAPWNTRASAWSDNQYDASHETSYQADSPADFVVEPFSDTELTNP